MSCIPASHSMNTLLTQVDSQLEEGQSQRRGSKAYQIFPETNDNDDSDAAYPDDFLYQRERLPSIVVEPTEQSEDGEQRWPPRCLMGDNLEEEDEDSTADHTDGSLDGELQEDTGMEEGSAVRKSSIGPSPSLLSLSRLTPPASPTPPEAAPPCLRS